MNRRMGAAEDDSRVEVFVYGTLRAGEINHDVILRHGGQWVGPATTEPAYVLFDLGPFPAMVEGGATPVGGDVYSVTAEGLRGLDLLEGHPTFYRRQAIRLADGTSALSYVLPRRFGAGRAVIPGGDWVAHRVARDGDDTEAEGPRAAGGVR